MNRLFALLMFLSLYSTTVISQNSQIDSQWSFQKFNESNIPVYLRLAENYEIQYPDTAISIYSKILEVLPGSKSGINHSRYKAKVLYSMAHIYIIYKADYDNGFKKTSEALKLYNELLLTSDRDDIAIEAQVGKGNCYLNIGRIHEKRGNFPLAIESYLEATKIFSELNEDKNIAKCYMNIGSIHDCIGDYRKSFEYYNKALVILKQYDISNDLGECLLNIALRYDGLEMRDSALVYYFKARDVYEKLNNASGLGQTYYNIAELYAVYDSSFNEMDAKRFFHLSLGYLLPSGDMFSISELYSSLSNFYNKLGKYDTAKVYALQALRIANNLKSIYLKCNPYHYLSTAYEGSGRIDSALICFKLYKDTYDALYSDEYKQVCIDAAVKETISSYYKDIQDEKLRIKRNWNIILATIILLSLIFGAILYYVTRRNILHKNKIKIRDSLLEGEEKERNRIGRELHDGVCSELSAVKMNLNIVKTGCSDQIEIDQVISNLSTINESIRNISHDLNSMVLLKFGLIPAINNLFEKVKSLHSCKVDIEISEFDNPLEKSIESNIYRIIQEIINNIVKHAKATEISFYLGQDKKKIAMIIKDNGIGFVINSEKAEKGIGLNNIKYRVALLNGKIDIQSDMNAGTKFVIEFPVVK